MTGTKRTKLIRETLWLFILFGLLFVLAVVSVDAGEPIIFNRALRTDQNITTTKEHHELHEGHSYCATDAGTLNSGQSRVYLLNTPSDVDIHMFVLVKAEGEGRLDIYEGATVSALGVALELNNHNRRSPNTAGLAITRGPTITDIGDLLEGATEHFGSGQTGEGETRGTRELILKRSTLYIYNSVSESASNEINTNFSHYEDSGDAR